MKITIEEHDKQKAKNRHLRALKTLALAFLIVFLPCIYGVFIVIIQKEIAILGWILFGSTILVGLYLISYFLSSIDEG